MNFYQKWCLKKAQIKHDRLVPLYGLNQSILDIGSGNCALSLLLKKSNYNITSLDIKNKSAFNEIVPIVYDGHKLPFKDNAFDVVQLITVLHHIKDPETIVKEAKRVGKKVIIMEDIYTNTLQKWITFAADSINNWEFMGHPHTNKTDEEWKAIFYRNDLEIESVQYYNFLLLFKQVTYKLTRKTSTL